MRNKDNISIERAYRKILLKEGIDPSRDHTNGTAEARLKAIISSLLRKMPQSPELKEAMTLVDGMIADQQTVEDTHEMDDSDMRAEYPNE